MLSIYKPLYKYKLFARHDVQLFPVSRIYLGHSIAFIALVFWVLQIITGFILLGLIAYSLEVQYVEIISIAFHGNFVWLLRLLHMLCANFVIISTLAHLGKALSFSQVASPQKFLVWLVGSVIFLLSLATAFTGYVVVSGNMSYWAALVILNLFSVVPVLGEEIVSWILSAATVTSWSIRRFTAIHFLLALASAAAFALHIILLHRTAPAKFNSEASINTETLWHVVVKDLSIFLLAVLPVFFESTKTLVHPDNWQAYSRLITPAHIEPEIYFFVNFLRDKIA